MPEKYPRTILTRLLWLAALLIFAASVVIARATGHGHWVNRGGAVIAALAAGAVLLQIMVEIQLDRQREMLEAARTPEENALPPGALPLEVLEFRLAQQELESKKSELHHDRLLVARRVVVTAIVGELLHGLGDVATCGWLLTCHD